MWFESSVVDLSLKKFLDVEGSTLTSAKSTGTNEPFMPLPAPTTASPSSHPFHSIEESMNHTSVETYAVKPEHKGVYDRHPNYKVPSIPQAFFGQIRLAISDTVMTARAIREEYESPPREDVR